jgi:integrase
LRAFHASWDSAPITALKKVERLRAFFRFVQEAGWATENPAAKLKNQRITAPPTMPFEQEEMVKIIAARDHYTDTYGRTGQDNARRLRAFVLLLRYSGLRIGDAIALPVEHVRDGKLFLRTAKTGTIVRCPLPEQVLQALDAFRRPNKRYFFWTGEGKITTATGGWQRSLRKLFALAGLPDGHAHRFRDTYAIELLLNGVPLERVSALLGHSSIKVTEKHYTPRGGRIERPPHEMREGRHHRPHGVAKASRQYKKLTIYTNSK